jgi:hypothetical protein
MILVPSMRHETESRMSPCFTSAWKGASWATQIFATLCVSQMTTKLHGLGVTDFTQIFGGTCYNSSLLGPTPECLIYWVGMKS